MGVPGLVSFSAAGAIRVPEVARGPRTAEMGRTLGLNSVCGGCWLGRRYILGRSWLGEGVLMTQKLEGYLGLRVGFWELDLTSKLNWDLG